MSARPIVPPDPQDDDENWAGPGFLPYDDPEVVPEHEA